MAHIFDTNVLLDMVTQDPSWSPWSSNQFWQALARGKIIINPLIYAELSVGFSSPSDVEVWVSPKFFQRAVLPYAAAWSAGKAFAAYRKRGGIKTSPLPDFYIGAHAECDGLTIVTRDPTRYRTYFPTVPLIVPEAIVATPHKETHSH